MDSHTLMKAKKWVINLITSYGWKRLLNPKSSRFFRGNEILIQAIYWSSENTATQKSVLKLWCRLYLWTSFELYRPIILFFPKIEGLLFEIWHFTYHQLHFILNETSHFQVMLDLIWSTSNSQLHNLFKNFNYF